GSQGHVMGSQPKRRLVSYVVPRESIPKLLLGLMARGLAKPIQRNGGMVPGTLARAPHADCPGCHDRNLVRIRCTDAEPAPKCDARQVRPHAHLACTKCMGRWIERLTDAELAYLMPPRA